MILTSQQKIPTTLFAATSPAFNPLGCGGRYSTLVKGYCMDGDIDKGFAVLKDMTSRNKHEPDEILYNSLLDGCAKSRRPLGRAAVRRVRASGRGLSIRRPRWRMMHFNLAITLSFLARVARRRTRKSRFSPR